MGQRPAKWIVAAIAMSALVAGGSIAMATRSPGTASEISADVTSSLSINDLPSNLTPSVASAGVDTAYVDTPSLKNCNVVSVTINLAKCVYGDTKGRHTMVLWGDSHAFMWFPAVNAVATAAHWKLVVMMEFGCPPADISVWNPVTKTPYTVCDVFRRNVISKINKLRPSLAILTEAFTSEAASGGGASNTITTTQWQAALQKTLKLLDAKGMKKVVLGSTITGPGTPTPGECLAANPTSVQTCTVKDTPAQLAARTAEQAATKAAKSTYVDVLPWLCSASVTPMACPAVIGDATAGYRVVYYAAGHLTETYDLWLTSVLQAALKPHMV